MSAKRCRCMLCRPGDTLFRSRGKEAQPVFTKCMPIRICCTDCVHELPRAERIDPGVVRHPAALGHHAHTNPFLVILPSLSPHPQTGR